MTANLAIQARRGRRSGFTLLELLIVLSLMLMVLSLAFPSYERSLSRTQFKEGVVGLQTEFLQIRLTAMKSGSIQALRFRPGTGHYEVLPLIELQRQWEEKADTPGLSVPIESSIPDRYEKETSGSVRIDSVWIASRFSADESRSEQGTPQTESSADSSFSGSLTVAENKVEDEWSPPILFYPNGSTTQAVFLLSGSTDGPWYSEIVLRGMTGTARISAISVYPPDSPHFPSALTPEIHTVLKNSGTIHGEMP